MSGFEKRTEEKKNQVLEATFKLMNRDTDGSNITMEDIAKHAHVAKATIFKYFGNKEKLIHEVFKHFLNKMGEETRKIMDEDKPFEETLIAISKNKINFLDQINKPFYLKLMEYLTTKNEGELSTLMQQYTQESYGIMLDIFHKGRKEGKVDLKYSDEFLLLYFQSLVEGISNPNIYPKIKPYTEEWTEMLIKGIAPEKK